MSKSAQKFVAIPPPKVVSGAGSRPAEEIFDKEEASVSMKVSEVSEPPSSARSPIAPELITPEPVVKSKKPRSRKQLDHLARIREKSLIARQQKAEQKRRQVTYAAPPTPAAESPPAPRAAVAPPSQQFVSAPQPVQTNYLSAEQIQTIVRDTMTHTLGEYSQRAVARQEAKEVENKKKHEDLVKQEVDLRQKKIQQGLLRRPTRKNNRF